MIPQSILDHWGELLISEQLIHFKSTRYRVLNWRHDVALSELDFEWSDIGFTSRKLTQLRKKYPLAHLPKDGCIIDVTPRGVHYRKVDLIKGWLADIKYLQALDEQHAGGYKGPVTFYCPGKTATIHAVRLSAVFPRILASGAYKGCVPHLRKTLKRACVHRLERRYEHYGQAKRANDWAWNINTESEMRLAIKELEE